MKDTEKKAEKTQEIAAFSARPHRVGMDINFSRASGIFASRSTRGFRKLPSFSEIVDGKEVTYYVSVGVWRGTQISLDSDDELAFLSVYGAWEKLGCNMNDLRLIVALTRALEWKNEEKRGSRNYGAREFKKLTVSLDKLATIQMIWDRYVGNESATTEPMTILKRVKVFDRADSLKKGEGYFQMSELNLNPIICQNIKDGKIKLFYLSELRSLRSETARLIYNRLELFCGVIQLPFRREVFSFSKECQIISDVDKIDKKIELKKIRRACRQLIGRKLTSGVIKDCYVESVKDQGVSKWFFVCDVVKAQTIRHKKNGKSNGMIHVVPDHEDLDTTKKKIDAESLLSKYEQLNDDSKKEIKECARKISKEKYNGYLEKESLIEAIGEYVGMKNLYDEIHSIKKSIQADPSASCVSDEPRAGTEYNPYVEPFTKDNAKKFKTIFRALLISRLQTA